MFRFVIFGCNYPVDPHVAAAAWPCTYSLLLPYRVPLDFCI